MVLESNTLDVLFVKDGQQGEDGKVLYTWIKYAKDANGTGMTDDPNGAIYIGISYNNESSIESNDPTQYAWTKIQGADGKKGEDAYTIFLENENISFATDKNRNPLSEQAYTSGITIMKGAKPVTDFAIGNIAKTQGIAVAKTDTAIAISVVNGNPLPNDSGEIEIPVTVGGTVFKKILTWTCAKKGEQGEKGEQGIQGPQGEQGIAGKDGTSVTITNKSITYQLSTSGTTIPTGTWQTTPQAIPEGQYQWTKTSVTYSDGNKTESYSISYHGKNGSDGTSVKTTSTSVKYQVGDSGTTKPTGTWQSNVPTVAQGKYLWTQTIVNYSDGNSTESYSVSYKGIDGSNGVNGMNAATIYLYQRNTSKPSKPSASVTYTFSTGVASGLNNGWSQKIPDGTNPLYVTLATASSNTATDTILSSEWSDVVVMAQNGEDGQDGISPKVSLSKSGDTTTISIVDATGTHTQTVKDGTNGTPGAAGKDGKTSYFHVKYSNDGGKTFTANSGEDTGIYMGSYTDYTEADSTDVKKYNWVKVKGDKGDTGQKGKDGTSIKITSKSVTYQTSTSGTTAPTGTWSTTVPTVNNGQYLWTKTTVQYSDGNKTEAYSVSYKGTNGTNGTSVTVSKTEVTYQVSTSGTNAPTGTWSTTMPSCDQGQYLWTKTYVKYSDGKDTTSYSVSYKGVDGADGQDGAGFHWNLLKYSGDLSQMFYGKVGGYIDTQEFISDASTPSKNVLKSTITTVGNGIYIQGKYLKKEAIKKGNTYTVSAWCKCSSTKDIGVMNVEFLDKKVNISMPKLSTEWQQYIITGVANKDVTTTSGGSAISFYYGNKMAVGDIFYISSPKVEEGDKASPWCTTYEETLAKNLSTTPSAQIFKSTDGGNTFAPNQITITPTLQGDITFGKWQYSIDGGVSFADVVSGQKGLTISNNVLSVSKDSSLYSDAVTMVIFRAVANDSSFYDTCSIAKIYDVSELEIGGVNLFVKSTVSRGYWLSDTGVLNANGGWGYSDYIDVSRMKNYIASGFTNLGISPATCFYDSNKTFISGVQSTNQNSQDSKRKTLPIPSNAKYMRFSFMLVDIDTLKIEQGTKATAYSPSPEDVQTAILSTKSEISNVSLKVDKNKQAIEQRVEKTTYQQDLNLVKGDISKANEGLNKWRYEIYPKSLFTDKPEDQSKYDIGVFIRNKNLTPSQSVLLDDASLSTGMNYGDSHIGYGLTFIKMSAAKSITTTFYNDDGASFYVNGKLIISRTSEYTNGQEITFTLVQGWNCLEVVLNEVGGSEGFRFSQTLSKLSECQLMNCYYGTPIARQSHITNQLVENITNIEGVRTTMQKVMTTVGGSDKIDEFVNNYNKTIESEKQFKKTIGETYTTKDEFNGLEIGGRNLLTKDDCNMSKWQNLYPAHCKITNNDYSNHIDYVPTGGEWEIVYKKISVVKGQKYILSFDYKVNKAYSYLSGQKYGVYLSTSVPTNAAPANIITTGQYIVENTVTNIKRGMITFTATVDTLYIVINGGCINDNQTGLSFEFNKWKLEKGNKATDWTPAPEDDEINGQNLVSNLPANWEQGIFQDSKTNVGCDYDTNKAPMITRIRVKELVPVSGSITISNAYSNQSKKPILHWITAFDVNKKWLGASYVSTAWSAFPRTVDMKDAKYIAVIVGYEDGSAITPSDISQICLKIERGTSATPFILAPEDVNGKIVNVETIANQTAKKFEWIVKGGDSSSNFTLTDRVADLVAERINFKGLVTFSGTTNLIENSNMMNGLANITSECKAIKVIDDSTYRKALVITPIAGGRIFWGVVNVWKANITYTVSFVAKSSVAGQKIKPSRSVADWGDEITLTTSYVKYTTRIKSTATADGGTLSFSFSNAIGDVTLTNVKLETGMNPTDWSPAPGDYITQASLVRNWTTNTTWINGGKIYTGSITADKIATDAIKSRNYISSGGTQGSFLNLSDGSFTSPNLSWDSNGNLIAKNANLSGEIAATKGTVGKYKITDQWLITGSGSTCTGMGGDQAFWAGAESSNSAPFRVGYDGKFVSSNADISGKITATEGKIGKYEITDTCLITGSGSTCTGIGGNFAFWAGGEDSYFAPFRVNYDGQLNIEHIKVHGNQEDVYMTIAKDYLEIQDVNTSAYIGLDGFDFDFANSRIKNGDQGIELYGDTPYIDFHYNNSYNDYTSRIIAQKGWDCLSFTGSIELGADLYANGWIYNAPGGHYTWNNRNDAYISCGNYNNTNNIYYYAGYHAFYVNGDSGSGMMYIETSGVSSRKGFRNSSDERIKQNFSHFDNDFIDTYMNLEPVQYQFKNDTNDKYHFGFKAQQTEQILNAYGQESDKSYGICATHAIDPEKAEKLYGVKNMHEEYTLAYDELIAPTTYMVQYTYKELESTKDELTKVKQEKADLETRLQAIEAKLGL